VAVFMAFSKCGLELQRQMAKPKAHKTAQGDGLFFRVGSSLLQ